jgi:hypothetical protein
VLELGVTSDDSSFSRQDWMGWSDRVLTSHKSDKDKMFLFGRLAVQLVGIHMGCVCWVVGEELIK